MSLFNRIRNKTETAPSSAETNNPWENLESSSDFSNQTKIASAEADQTNAHLQSQERQERKIIDAFLRGNNGLSKPDANISEYERQIVYDYLANGTITDQQKSNLISNIATPVDRSPENTIDSMQDKHELRILTYLSGTGFDYWQSASIYDLRNALNRFPTPYELKSAEENLLNDIREHNSPQKYAEYQEAMANFKQKFYGKRLEYYNSMESLQTKANKAAAEKDARTQVLHSYTSNQAPTQPETISKPIELQPISAQEKADILKSSQIDGDDFFYQGQAYQLTPASLEQAGLAPNYKFTLQNAEVNLSDPYQVQDHAAVTAYIKTENGTKVCSYYRSNSQGIWRLLPDYVSDTKNNKLIEWFGKGYNEESLNLPSETQYALELISNNRPPVEVNPVNAAFYFAGTAKRYNSKDEYRSYVNQHTLRGNHYQEVSPSASFNLGTVSFTKVPPQTLDLTGPNAPNFQNSENSYVTNTGLYGQIQVEHFPSADKSLKYTFNRDTAGQAWIGNVEINHAKISSTGLRTEWASIGDYGTPLYEYARQADGYGDASKARGNYLNMWKNYLSHMPIIQKYLASKKDPISSL